MATHSLKYGIITNKKDLGYSPRSFNLSLPLITMTVCNSATTSKNRSQSAP